MDSFMSLQITNLRKLLETMIKCKTFFSRMDSFIVSSNHQLKKNYLKQWSHVKFISPLRIVLCLFKWPTEKNYLKQLSYVKHFSPVQILSWLFKSTTKKNYFKQWSNVKHFSPAWILLCIFKSPT